MVQSGTQQGTVSDIDGKFNLELENDSALVIAKFIGMEKSEFQPNIDEEVLISLQEQNTELDEVVTIGYGTQKKSTVKSSNDKVTSDFKTAPQPIGGMEDYENYLKKNAILPNNYPRNKETVKVLLKINKEGGITEITNKNKANSAVFKIAEQLITDGPSWQPKQINGEMQKSEFLLKIVFRKLE